MRARAARAQRRRCAHRRAGGAAPCSSDEFACAGDFDTHFLERIDLSRRHGRARTCSSRPWRRSTATLLMARARRRSPRARRGAWRARRRRGTFSLSRRTSASGCGGAHREVLRRVNGVAPWSTWWSASASSRSPVDGAQLDPRPTRRSTTWARSRCSRRAQLRRGRSKATRTSRPRSLGHLYAVEIEDERERAAHAAGARKPRRVAAVSQARVDARHRHRRQAARQGRRPGRRASRSLILEAMKMQNEIAAPSRRPSSRSLHVREREAVSGGAKLVTIAPAG
jgi:hypothetical protein